MLTASRRGGGPTPSKQGGARQGSAQKGAAKATPGKAGAQLGCRVLKPRFIDLTNTMRTEYLQRVAQINVGVDASAADWVSTVALH